MTYGRPTCETLEAERNNAPLHSSPLRCVITKLSQPSDVEQEDVHWLKIGCRANYVGDLTGEIVKAIEMGAGEFYRVSGTGRGIFVLQAYTYPNGVELMITSFAGRNVMGIAPQILSFARERARAIGARWFSVCTEDPRLSRWIERRGKMKISRWHHTSDLGRN